MEIDFRMQDFLLQCTLVHSQHIRCSTSW